MERFKKSIFKQREEINDRMAEMFGLLKELTTIRTAEKVLVVDKNVREPGESNVVEPIEEVDGKEEVEDGTDDDPVRSVKEELMGEKVE
ncbi:hypothetical protein Tco_1168451 [Tanacetum coccineum]